MATVYRATRLLIGDTVAIKILHPDQVRDPQSAERFRREAQAAARLKHPNAVTIHDFGVSADGLIYLVMELVEGKSVRAMIREQGPLTPTTAAEILRQACAALEEAHKQNIVHRDVKPDNIVVAVTPAGLRVKVLDFGIARMRDIAAANITQTGSVMGTPHYMSPEQCLGEELDNRSDIYSLGVVLFEMLAGIVPFNSPTSSAVIIQHVNQAPPPLRVINISVPPAVESVVLRALSKRREDRPQSAQLLADELNSAVAPGSLGRDNTSIASSKGDLTVATAAGFAPTLQMSTPALTSDRQQHQSKAIAVNRFDFAQWFDNKKKSVFIGGGLIAGLLLLIVAVKAVSTRDFGINQNKDQGGSQQTSTPAVYAFERSIPKPLVPIVSAANVLPTWTQKEDIQGNYPLLTRLYVGALGKKPFKLVISNVDTMNKQLSGYSQVSSSRVDFEGKYTLTIREPDSRVAANVVAFRTWVFGVTAFESTGVNHSGVFQLSFNVTDAHGGNAFGSWISYDGRLYREIRLTDTYTAQEQQSDGEAPHIATVLQQTDVPYSTNTFLDNFRDIDARTLNASDLAGLATRELGLLRNFVYARHGRAFTTPMYRTYFSQFAWYRVDPSYTDALLNRIEIQNLEIIQRQEKTLGATK